MGIDPHQPLDVWTLADHWGIPIYGIGELAPPGEPAIQHFTAGSGAPRLSAYVMPVGTGLCITVNDSHAPTRQKSSIAHELGHVILEHDFPFSLFGDDKCHSMNSELEDEANWFGAELILPTEAARRLAVRRCSDADVAQMHGVSHTYAKMRMNTTGARLVASRASARSSHP